MTDGPWVQRYCDIVTGKVIVGASLFHDLFAGVRDIAGGRAVAWEQRPGANDSMLPVSTIGTAVVA